MVRGRSYTFECQVTSENGAPVSLVGAVIKGTAKVSPNDPDNEALITKDYTNGVTITDSVNGKFTVLYFGSDTNLIKVNKLYIEYVVKLSDGSFLTTGILTEKLEGNVLKTLF